MDTKFNFYPITTSDHTRDDFSSLTFKSSIEEDLKSYIKKHTARNYSKEEIERMNKEWRGKDERESFDRYR